jgi:Rad3-related DNA helicase
VARETAVAISGAKGGKAALASDGVATDLVATARVLEQRCEEGAAFMHGGEAAQIVRWLRLPYASGAGQQADTSRGRAPGQPRAQPPNESAASAAIPHAARDGAAARTGAAGELADENAEIPVLQSAPIAIGSSLAPLLGPDSALVLAGPALAVAGDFTYTRGALQLPESVPTLEPATDRADQTLLCLPTDVPEPNAQQYQRHLDDALIGLAAGLGGRLVAIFPSHAALRASAHGIRRALERHDILVLAQGQDGSARQLWHTFRTEPRVVLLGAGSFWEGAEQIEQPPACVVVTRIPFPALSDPLLAALADSWPDPQSQFVVPHAALRVRQALGGLAWSHNRRNAVVLFDRRAQTRGYSSTLLGTLPRCTQYQESMAQITERAVEWVG